MNMRPLGMTADAEALYRAVLMRPGIDTPELCQLTGLEAPPLGTLEELQRRGLVSRSAREGAGWNATPPAVAIELLLMERQAALNQARRLVPALQEDLARVSSTPVAGDVQVLSSDPQSQLQSYLDLYARARSGIMSVARPPFLVAAPEAIASARADARRRGIRVRSILAAEVMGWDGWRAAAAQALEDGEEIRVLDDPPFKMLIAEGVGAMLPLYASDPNGPALRLGNTTPVLAVTALFEQLWAVAVPVGATAGEATSAGDAAADDLITLLAAGTNDKSTADALKISDRTLQRRIAALCTELKAKSRFQAGWLAARRFGR